jgi:hypothetical protein
VYGVGVLCMYTYKFAETEYCLQPGNLIVLHVSAFNATPATLLETPEYTVTVLRVVDIFQETTRSINPKAIGAISSTGGMAVVAPPAPAVAAPQQLVVLDDEAIILKNGNSTAHKQMLAVCKKALAGWEHVTAADVEASSTCSKLVLAQQSRTQQRMTRA